MVQRCTGDSCKIARAFDDDVKYTPNKFSVSRPTPTSVLKPIQITMEEFVSKSSTKTCPFYSDQYHALATRIQHQGIRCSVSQKRLLLITVQGPLLTYSARVGEQQN